MVVNAETALAKGPKSPGHAKSVAKHSSVKAVPKQLPVKKLSHKSPHKLATPWHKPGTLHRPLPRPHHVHPRHLHLSISPTIVIGPRLRVPRVIRTRVVAPAVVRTAVVPVAAGPDLAVVDVRSDFTASGGLTENSPQVTATIKNLGGKDYRSDQASQVLVLYKNGELVAQRGFSNLAVGQVLRVSAEGDSVPAIYEAQIVYADGIHQDGNPANDDTNPQNDSLSRELGQ